jgi:hypothetical protein
MPFIYEMAKGSVYNSIDIRTNKRVDMTYGIRYLGLGADAQLAYGQSLYDFLRGCSEERLLKVISDLSTMSKVYISPRWLEENLSEDKFSIVVI